MSSHYTNMGYYADYNIAGRLRAEQGCYYTSLGKASDAIIMSEYYDKMIKQNTEFSIARQNSETDWASRTPCLRANCSPTFPHYKTK